MKTLEEQFRNAVLALEQAGLRYALAGGLAAAVYRDEDRVTKDVDFIIGGEGDVLEAGERIVHELGLRSHIARLADFEGGPLFAIKKQNTPEVAILGRDPEKRDPGIDFLLPSNKWAPRALERSQHNRLNFGFALVPTLTVEDVIVAKLIASHRSEREQDILDLRSIFRAGHEIDVVYVVARMKEFRTQIPHSLEKDAPVELLRASKRIARENRKKPA